MTHCDIKEHQIHHYLIIAHKCSLRSVDETGMFAHFGLTCANYMGCGMRFQ